MQERNNALNHNARVTLSDEAHGVVSAPAYPVAVTALTTSTTIHAGSRRGSHASSACRPGGAVQADRPVHRTVDRGGGEPDRGARIRNSRGPRRPRARGDRRLATSGATGPH